MNGGAACRDFSPGYNRPDGSVNLRELRARCGYSLRDVESETGINRGRLSLIERGTVVPSPTDLLTLSDLYEVDPGAWELHLEFRLTDQEAST